MGSQVIAIPFSHVLEGDRQIPVSAVHTRSAEPALGLPSPYRNCS
jgi:hypothetical protein